jgi:hypothetical protein
MDVLSMQPFINMQFIVLITIVQNNDVRNVNITVLKFIEN